MSKRAFTYLNACLKNGLTVRWPESMMPLKVYIAPFTWYEASKQRQSDAYRQMVINSFEAWSQATNRKITYQLVNNLHDSNIDINWRRVDRKSLGHCEYLVNDKSIIYSAEIRIGISDGLVHGQYNDIDEVKHTILHEIGHALGLLGHSDGPGDIMYVPHQFGVASLSERDKTTMRVLYDLPIAFNHLIAGEKLGLDKRYPKGYGFDTVIDVLEGRSEAPISDTAHNIAAETTNPKPTGNPAKLMEHHDILTQMGKFHMATQNIRPQSRKS